MRHWCHLPDGCPSPQETGYGEQSRPEAPLVISHIINLYYNSNKLTAGKKKKNLFCKVISNIIGLIRDKLN